MLKERSTRFGKALGIHLVQKKGDTFCPKIPIRSWFEKYHPDRRLFIHLSRLRLSHATTPEFLHRIWQGEDPFYSCDLVSLGDINHVLLGYKIQKTKIDRFYTHLKGNIRFPTNLHILMATLDGGGRIADLFLSHVLSNGFI